MKGSQKHSDGKLQGYQWRMASIRDYMLAHATLSRGQQGSKDYTDKASVGEASSWALAQNHSVA